jgi:hypothetical protein
MKDYDVFKEMGGADLITTGVPKASADQMYAWSLFNAMAQLERCFATLETVTDPRPGLLIRQVIAHVVDDDIRAELFAKFDQKYLEILSGPGDTREKAKEMLYAINLLAGEVLAWMDQAIGVYEKNTISFIGDGVTNDNESGISDE